MELKIKPAGTKLDKVLDRLPSFTVTERPAPSEEAARDLGTIWGARSIADAIRRASERLDQGFEPPAKPKK